MSIYYSDFRFYNNIKFNCEDLDLDLDVRQDLDIRFSQFQMSGFTFQVTDFKLQTSRFRFQNEAWGTDGREPGEPLDLEVDALGNKKTKRTTRRPSEENRWETYVWEQAVRQD